MKWCLKSVRYEFRNQASCTVQKKQGLCDIYVWFVWLYNILSVYTSMSCWSLCGVSLLSNCSMVRIWNIRAMASTESKWPLSVCTRSPPAASTQISSSRGTRVPAKPCTVSAEQSSLFIPAPALVSGLLKPNITRAVL